MVYGIPNCDTVKKSLQWLKANKVEFEFHNFKTQGVTKKKLNEWVSNRGWENIINLKSATYRKLIKEGGNYICNKQSALKMMITNPSTIKRPIIENHGMLIVGFNKEEFQKIKSHLNK